MLFSEALQNLKNGAMISRQGWNGKGMWLQLFSNSEFVTVACEPHETPDINTQGYDSHIDNNEIKHIGVIGSDGNYYPMGDFILMKTADNKVIPWLASQTDILADDWGILPLSML